MKTAKKIQAFIEYAALLGAAALFRWLPLPLATLLAVGVGWLASNVLQIRRKVALDNLGQAFPAMTKGELEVLYRRVWRHFARVAAELARLPRMMNGQLKQMIDDEEVTIVRELVARGKGIIFVSGHLGNWEWLGALTSSSGIPMTYVVAGQTNRLVERWLERMRTTAGVEIVNRRDPARAILTALKRGRIVAMLSDQDAGPAGVFVRFFDRPASTPRGPALFHLRTGAPLLFGGCTRRTNGRYKIAFEEIVPSGITGDNSVDERIIMQEAAARLEREIRIYPDQYFWLHRRWKTKPPVGEY